MRKASTFDAQSATTATVAFFKRWWKLLTIVFVCAAIVSAVVSLFIKPMYLATGVMMPTNSNRLTKAIMDYDYSMDFGERYDIKPDDKHRNYYIGKKYNRYLNVKRTDFMGIEISIVDRDPQVAADMVNYIMDKYDTLCREIHRDRAEDAAMVMNAVCAAAEEEMDSVANTGKASAGKDYLLRYKGRKLAEMQARAVQTSVDKDMAVHYRYVVDRAVPADKKDRPKRALIVMGGSVGTLVVCIFGLLVFVPAKKEDEE